MSRRGRRRRFGNDRWASLAGTVLGLGRVPFAPGTVASVAWGLVYWVLPDLPVWFWLITIALLTVVGILSAYEMEDRYGHNPSRFVLDEVVGMQVALLGVPGRMDTIITAIVLFRLFDVIKPPPIAQVETLRGGVGVMADDVLAGALARLVLWVFAIWGFVVV